MSEAYYDDAARREGSLFDQLADKVRGPLKTQAGALALAADKGVTAFERAKTAAGPKIAPAVAHIHRQRVPYALVALAVGVGVGLLLHRPTRQAAGKLARKGWDGAQGGLGQQLGKELRSLVHQIRR